MTKIQLPLFVDKNILPTDKYHVSFSEFLIHKICSFKYKLQYLDKLASFEGNIYTTYGKAIHDAIENYLKTRKMASHVEVEKYFYELMKPVLETLESKKRLENIKLMKEFSSHIEDTLKQVPEWLEKTFPGWKIHSAEFNLFENIKSQTNIHFKGFIDAVIMVPKKERKNAKKSILRLSDFNNNTTEQKKEYEYHIIDWKVVQQWWSSDKRRDFKTQMQIILYKHYFCTKFNIPLKDVKCSFGLIRMQTPKNNKDRIHLFTISAGEKTIEKALQELNTMINMVRKRIFMKNRQSCKYCEFNGTRFCT